MVIQQYARLALFLGVPLGAMAAAPRMAAAAVIISNAIDTTPTRNPTISIPLPPIGSALPGLDPYHELTVSITDLTAPPFSVYLASLNETPLPLIEILTNPNTVVGISIFNNGPTPTVTTPTVTTPPTTTTTTTLAVTSQYQAQTPSGPTAIATNAFAPTLTEVAAPEPASLAILGVSFTLLGLARRHQARRAGLPGTSR